MKKLSIWFIILASAFFTKAQQNANNEIFAVINQQNFDKVSSIIQQNPLAVNLNRNFS